MLVDVGRKQGEVEREKISARVGPTLGNLGGERPRSSKQSRLVNFFGFGVG